jgi:hypothetical protein
MPIAAQFMKNDVIALFVLRNRTRMIYDEPLCQNAILVV